jgi:hypothetical protein
MPQAKKRIVVSQTGTKDIRYNVTGSGEQYYILRGAPIPAENLPKDTVTVSRTTSRAGKKKK